MTPRIALISFTPRSGEPHEVGALLETADGVRLLASRAMLRLADAADRDDRTRGLGAILAGLETIDALPDVGERFRLGPEQSYALAGRDVPEIPMRFREVRD